MRAMKNPQFLVVLLTAFILSACENSGASYKVLDQGDSISLLREQRYFWSGDVEQMLVPARLPQCQRRNHIDAGKTDMVKMELYAVRPMLYVAHQGDNWYAIGTEECQVQKFDTPPTNPGRLLGDFEKRNGELVFVPEDAAKPIK